MHYATFLTNNSISDPTIEKSIEFDVLDRLFEEKQLKYLLGYSNFLEWEFSYSGKNN